MHPCPSCRSTDLLNFQLAPRGETLSLTICRDCETRWWSDELTRAPLEPREALAHFRAA